MRWCRGSVDEGRIGRISVARRALCVGIGALWALSGAVAGEKAAARSAEVGADAPTLPPAAKTLTGPIAKMTPFLGTWRFEGHWANGQSLWSQNVYRVGLAGRFVEAVTYAKDGDGAVYERYLTVFGHDAKTGKYVTYGFTFDGTAKTLPMDVSETDGKLTLQSQWSAGPAAGEIRQRVTVLDKDTYRWQVWTRQGAGEWVAIMDGEWKRVKA